MKVYVEELPKSCWDCPCHKGDNGLCKLLQEYTDYVPKTCPLQSLSDYTKQVKKEVCDKVYDFLTTESVWRAFKKSWWLDNGECKELRKLLDQIQGE